MADVEILWPDKIDTEPLLEAVAFLEEAGVETECLVQPVRRGVPLEILVFIATPALEPFLKAVFAKVGGDAYDAVKHFVGRLLARRRKADADQGRPADAAEPEGTSGPSAVVFESTESGAQFVFTRGLPDDAYRAALEVDTGTTPGRWVWDPTAKAWMRFEDITA